MKEFFKKLLGIKPPPFCVNCAYYKRYEGNGQVAHGCSRNNRQEIDLITGETRVLGDVSCEFQRGDGAHLRYRCGPTGRFFKPKQNETEHTGETVSADC